VHECTACSGLPAGCERKQGGMRARGASALRVGSGTRRAAGRRLKHGAQNRAQSQRTGQRMQGPGARRAGGGRRVRPGSQNRAQLLDGERRAEQMQLVIHADPHTEGTHQETPRPPCCGRTRQRRRRRRRPRRRRPHTAPGAPFGAGLSRERLTSKNRTF